MAMTSSQLAYVKRYAGSVLDDATLNAIFDSTIEGNSDVDRTVYYALLTRYTDAWNAINETNPVTGFTIQEEAKFQHLKDLLNDWGMRVGISGGSITSGVLNLGIDSTCEDLTSMD